MLSSQSAAIILFWAQVVSGIAAAIFIAQFAYGQGKRVGRVDLTSFLSSHPRWIIGLIAFSLTCGIVGLWLTYRIPRAEKAAPCPTVSANRNQPTASQNSGRPKATKQSPNRIGQQENLSALSTKVADLPSNPKTQPTYEQKCEGSACAQGPGSLATLNQYGPRRRELSGNQVETFTNALRGVQGSITVLGAASTDDITPLISSICNAATNAGWYCNPVPYGNIQINGGPPSGTSITCYADNWRREDAVRLEGAMKEANLPCIILPAPYRMGHGSIIGAGTIVVVIGTPVP